MNSTTEICGVCPSKLQLVAKRTLDIVGATLGLVALAPLLALIALAVRLDGSGPVFFRQFRVGRDGRSFNILKFRSMTVNAESAGPHLTVHGDRRVTQVGRLLRAAKLDELPQLLNVLKGDMSLVGPRPETPDLLAHYTPADRALMLSLRPGMTDYASILLRNESVLLARQTDPDRFYREKLAPFKAALCARYLRRLSITTDLRIVFATALVVLSPSASPHSLGFAALDRSIRNEIRVDHAAG
jgi:lipopolysaccharide/colanic/teichoic acid biosynthesis glycosyltransferase